jgi:hypothetical protein
MHLDHDSLLPATNPGIPSMRLEMLIRVAAVMVLGAGSSYAQVATTLEAVPWRTSIAYGSSLSIAGVLRYLGEPCPAGTLPPVPGQLLLRDQAVSYGSMPLSSTTGRGCAGGQYIAYGSMEVSREPLEFGEYFFTLAYTGGPGYAPSVSPAVKVTVVPQASESSPRGDGTINIGVRPNDAWYCQSRSARLVHEATLPSAPAGTAFPYGAVNLRGEGCYYECGFLCWPGAPSVPDMRVVVEFPQPLPPSATLWELRDGAWSRLPGASVTGQRARGRVLASSAGNTFDRMVALGIGEEAPSLQDLWWAGEGENGWGVSIAQNGDRLFVVIFIYDEMGRPQWLAMPNGRWNATRTAWEGDLYRPAGAFHPRHDASRLRLGDAVGSARISVTDAMTGLLEYTIDGVSGTKQIRRQVFAPQGAARPGPHAGLWWGGESKSGWGLHLGHQEDTLFAVWYTYDAEGRGAWYVMPGGQWAGDRYSGALYRASGSPWLGQRYDPSRLVLTPVGQLGFTFGPAGTATLDYTIEGHSGTEALMRQPF